MSVLVIARHHGHDPQRRQAEDELAFLAVGAGHDVLTVPHLYHVAEDAPLWQRLVAFAVQNDERITDASLRSTTVVVAGWMHPRPLQALLEHHRAWSDRHHAVDLASADSAAVWMELAPLLGPSLAVGAATEADEAPRSRWYPLVDPERCVQCHHCLQFCIFGVYALDAAGQVAVANPDQCKPGCPACSRICAHSAIMFPLYGKDPAIAGAPGMLVQPDATTRRMWYQRTGKPCPTCGQSGAWKAGRPDAACGECGRQRPAAKAAPPVDDLDALMADLDRLDRRGGRRG